MTATLTTRELAQTSPGKFTLYELLDIFSLHAYKGLLAEAGLIDLLKQRSKITLLAPTDEAFDQMHPSVTSELASDRRPERIQTLARSHIVTSSLTAGFNLSGSKGLEQLCELRLGAVYDMNGDFLRLDWEASRSGRITVLHGINRVRPVEPSPFGTASASNGTLLLLTETIIGKSFLEQKYKDTGRNCFSEASDSKQFTLWECLTKLGLTKFCEAATLAGFDSILQEPSDKEHQIQVWAPVDEAFRHISYDYRENPSKLQEFVKGHLISPDRNNFNGKKFADTIAMDPALHPQISGKYHASNGTLVLMNLAFLNNQNPIGWNLNPTPR